MKVRNVQEVSPATAPEPVKPASAAATVTDKVTAEKALEMGATVASVRASAASARSARLQQIAAAVREGTYRPNANRVAQQILDSAELEARISALLQH